MEAMAKGQPNAKEQQKSGTVHKALTVTFFVVMAAIGFANVVIGSVNMNQCGNAMVLPTMLVMNGVTWILPVLLLTLINCVRHEHELVSMYSCLEKLFLLLIVFLVASTIYILVSATQVKSLDFLCKHTWLPPYILATLLADWVCFIVFFRLFCVHEVSPEEPPIEFKHLKNLPPLGGIAVFPWNRHRVIRTF